MKIEGADGIDPSLFFDEDGKCYYIGTHPNPDGCRYDGDWFIYIQEIDPETFEPIGEHKNVWNGAMRGVHWPEGPHVYHIGDYYYIIHAEGGTGPEHAVMVARSRSLDEPFVGLDPLATNVLKKNMRKHCEAGNAIFYSTHVLDVAERLCDRVAIMDHGRVVLTGEVKELIQAKT